MTFKVYETRTPLGSSAASIEVWGLDGTYKSNLRATFTLLNGANVPDFEEKQRTAAAHLCDYLSLMEGGP